MKINIILSVLLLSLVILTSLVSATEVKGTFTITEEEANAPQLSPDESLNQSEEEQAEDNTTEQPSIFTAIKNFFKALFNLFRK